MNFLIFFLKSKQLLRYFPSNDWRVLQLFPVDRLMKMTVFFSMINGWILRYFPSNDWRVLWLIGENYGGFLQSNCTSRMFSFLVADWHISHFFLQPTKEFRDFFLWLTDEFRDFFLRLTEEFHDSLKRLFKNRRSINLL